ncbi:MAG: hypothetical protein C0625_05080 [Arcobacter sp.]|nr:MAG: hypothetical protein C0625_05080 [Arcobacter sp.]
MSLFTKLFFSMLISIIVSFTIYVTTIINIEKKVVKDNLVSKIEYDKKLYFSSISVLLYELNKDVLVSLLNSIFEDKDIIKIELIDYTDLINLNLKKEQDDKSTIIKSEINLSYNKEILGKLQIYYTDKYIIERLDNYEKNIFTFSVILSIIILIVLFFFINKFTKSIVTLTNASSKIASGNLSERIYIKTNDEIGILAEKFEIMRTTLKDRIEKNEKQANEIKSLNDDLKNKVYERTLELEQSNKELHNSLNNLKMTQDKLIESEKMASLGSLVAGVAHEINTPVGIGLTGITHFLEITNELKEDYTNENMSQEDFENYLNTSKEIADLINVNLNRTAQLVKNFKQISFDQSSEERRKINLYTYIEEILFSMKTITKKTNLKIENNCNHEINIYTYPGAISQVITNLIINSIRHGFKDKEEGNITISASREENTIKLIYEDTGKGIDKEDLPKIFNPFFTTNRENGGTGLGLNILYNIISSTLYGTIRCISEKNKGVKFIILFQEDKKNTKLEKEILWQI